MLDDGNVKTFYSLRKLCEAVANKTNPVLFWIGAGASRWCGVPKWDELARIVHSEFSRLEHPYDRRTAHDFITTGDFPSLFQQCRKTNSNRYFSSLVDAIGVHGPSAVYLRFLDALRPIEPLNIITTNVDELLETNIVEGVLIQRSNLERCIALLRNGQTFVAKVHGSVSQVESMVFTASDYQTLQADEKYMQLMEHIFLQTTVLFVGYGLRDEYVLNLLARSVRLKNIFGGTEHFAIVDESVTDLPEFITPIHYIPLPHSDHRSAIQVIEELTSSQVPDTERSTLPFTIKRTLTQLKSAHLISDIVAPGKHETATEYGISDGGKLVQGVGLTDEELTSKQTTSMHDLMVGLLCFDTVYAHLPSLPNFGHLIGDEAFETILKEDCLRFIEWPHQEVMRFPNSDLDNGGDLITIVDTSTTPLEIVRRIIRESLRPLSGKESEAEQVFELIEKKTDSITREMVLSIPKYTRGLLLRPSIRKLIGMSGGTSVSRIPKWMMHPILRLAYVIKIGATCQLLGIASTKLDPGFSQLAGPAFAAARGAEWADGVAAYVLAQTFNADLSSYSLRNQQVLHAILRFRSTSEGVSLRKEIMEQLAIREAGDFVMSVNAGLRAIVPTGKLQKARDRMVGCLIAEGVLSDLTPAIWDTSDSARALDLWKIRSLRTLKEYCAANGILASDTCPCGSGDLLRDCCEASLEPHTR